MQNIVELKMQKLYCAQCAAKLSVSCAMQCALTEVCIVWCVVSRKNASCDFSLVSGVCIVRCVACSVYCTLCSVECVVKC